MLLRVLTLVAAVMFPLAASASDAVEAKMCLFAAAAKLPNVPGLKVVRATVGEPKADASAPAGLAMTFYRGEIEIEALGQQATYSYSCPVMGSAGQRQIFPNAFSVGIAR